MPKITLLSVLAVCLAALAVIGGLQKAIALAVQYPHTAAFGLALVVGPATVIGCFVVGVILVRRSL
jgi:hypothetical protein